MLWVYVTVTLMLVSGLGAQSETRGEAALTAIQDALEARCLKNANADVLEELKNTALNLGSCLKDPTPPENEEEMFNMICVETPQTAYRCLGNFVDKLEPCLDAEEKYLPVFLRETFNSTLEQHCKGGAAHIAELVTDLKEPECKISREELRSKVGKQCASKLKLVEHIGEKTDFVLTESLLCGDLHKASDCVVGILKEECEDDVYEKFLESTLEPFLNWCNKHESENVVD